ncbi:MAG: hypothetical protein WC839_00185 [Candidatus Paceibacterota bacterium]
MKKKKEEICQKKDNLLVVYYKYPRQWYYDKKNGQISLCKKCEKNIDKDYPLTSVLSTADCDERIKKILLEKKCPFYSLL